MLKPRVPFVLILVAIWGTPINAATCPAPISSALRLVMVTTSSMSLSSAKVQLFTRTTTEMPWRRVGRVEPAILGKAGIGWGHTFHSFKRDDEPEKFEGDG